MIQYFKSIDGMITTLRFVNCTNLRNLMWKIIKNLTAILFLQMLPLNSTLPDLPNIELDPEITSVLDKIEDSVK
jgi:hypothetical protein